MSSVGPTAERTDERLERAVEVAGRLLDNIELAIRGKREEIKLVLAALACKGHVLFEDVPGTAKTVLARAIAQSIEGAEPSRIQCTPDLQPTDVTGLSIWNQQTRDCEFRPGPIFSHVVLVDEINRAVPKAQSALLEAMAERQGTIDGVTRELREPFIVLATQNPIELEGTFPLPEAQLDRFFIRAALGYPGGEDELNIVAIGASVRGSLALERAARSWALLSSRDYVLPEDIELLFLPVLGHRILFTPSFLVELRKIGRTQALEDFRSRCLRAVPRPEATLGGDGEVVRLSHGERAD